MVVTFPLTASAAAKSQFEEVVKNKALKMSLPWEEHNDHDITGATSLEEARRAALDLLLFAFSKEIKQDSEKGEDQVERQIAKCFTPQDSEEDETSDRGFEVLLFTSVDKDELFLCVRMTLPEALRVAYSAQYRLQLSNDAIRALDIELPDWDDNVPAYVKYDPYYLKELTNGNIENVRSLLQMHESPTGEMSPLRSVDRIRLLSDLVMHNINLNLWRRHGIIGQIYPAHCRRPLLILRQRWASFSKLFCLRQPIDEIRDYFGESVAFYFAFVEFAVRSLLLVVACAVGLHIYGIVRGHGWDKSSHVVYATIISLWSTIFLEMWKRQQATLANRWGTDGTNHSSVQEQLSPYFDGAVIPFEGNTKKLVWGPMGNRAIIGRTVAILCTVLFSGVVLIAVYANLCLHGYLRRNGDNIGANLTSIALTLQIKFVDFVWSGWSTKLTILENNQFESTLHHSRSRKLVVVKLMNTFAGFFYIAFAQQFIEGCPQDGCMPVLSQSVFFVYVSYIVFGLMDVVVPILQVKWAVVSEAEKHRKETGVEAKPLSLLEMQAKMPSYSGSEQSDDFLQIFFPIFFVMFFGITFPLATILVPIVFLLQLRCDAWKLVHAYQRPYPLMAVSIGEWRMQLLEGVCYAAVFVNWGLIVFQLDLFQGYDTSQKFVAFFAGEQILLTLKVLIAWVIPDVPERVRVMSVRQDVQRDRFFNEEAETMNFALENKQEVTEQMAKSLSDTFGLRTMGKYPGLDEHSKYYEQPLIE
eukprot:CAMPEP_0170614350 /NCGR_PEP_ID=MMETSP0224-20130122/24754_1 /TAXON_ID=285029 /ORGANISM="Togula jolla, Strain CCCM 725" /LENGTH=753 /DNA_ID=CAMNT_0010940003 /DNA_START=79 /DNA_END=2338 /DNA_ORIENTATION=-